MSLAKQHRIYHQGLRDFLVEIGIEPTRENIEEVKKMFKRYLNVNSVASLTPNEYSKVISATFMLAARHWGVELPRYEADKSMKELLSELHNDRIP